MKCSSCSADNAPGTTFCEYCGTALGKKPTANEVFDKKTGSESAGSNAPGDFMPSATDPAFQLWNNKNTLPKSAFNWWALLFPFAYLAGYGARKSAIAALVSLLAPTLLAVIIFHMVPSLAKPLLYSTYVLAIIYAYRVATKTDALIGGKPGTIPFNIGIAIVAQIIYLAIYNFLIEV